MACDIVAREANGADSSCCTVCTVEGARLTLAGCRIENRSSDTRLAENGKQGIVSIAASNSGSAHTVSCINKSRVANSTFSIGLADCAIFRAIHGYFGASSIDKLKAWITESAVSFAIAGSAERRAIGTDFCVVVKMSICDAAGTLVKAGTVAWLTFRIGIAWHALAVDCSKSTFADLAVEGIVEVTWAAGVATWN